MGTPGSSALSSGVLEGDRVQIARAITLLESSRADHQHEARALVAELLPHGGKSLRVGITGVPGAGKSTFIDALGMMLLERGDRVAVLAVDPSSSRTGGSILGDRTRMADLGRDPRAFIRPSPTSGTLGGVARATRESIVVMEAAGYDVVLVETVGVGQSEVTVASMVDCFLLLALARSGDELQGIKKGVLELADVVAINKADGDHLRAAEAAGRELTSALRLTRGHDAWTPPVLACSALEKRGLDRVWDEGVLRYEKEARSAGVFEKKRAEQQLAWMWSMIEGDVMSELRADPNVAQIVREVSHDVSEGRLSARTAASRILTAFASRRNP